ncbi:MAG TPA: hypothetical protein VGJ09_02750 [Bryobacteraceae bacterium]|jgi:hypothetical protein
MVSRRWLGVVFLAAAAMVGLQAQVLEFESGGLKYKALTRGGVTIMFAPLPTRVLGYTILQVAISNGSATSWSFKAEDFRFEQAGGRRIQAVTAGSVVKQLLDHASRGDVGRLISAYESALFGNARVHSTNGYESRRQDYLALGSTKLKAASAASAIALVTTRLTPGQSTDGAVFYPTSGKPLGNGKLIISAAAEVFEFPVEAEPPQRAAR